MPFCGIQKSKRIRRGPKSTFFSVSFNFDSLSRFDCASAIGILEDLSIPLL